MLLIYDYLEEVLQKHLEKNGINATISSNIGRAWHCYRYIQVHSLGVPHSVHYEYINGHWKLHFEHYDQPEESDRIRKHLASEVDSEGSMRWHRSEGRHRGYLAIDETVEDVETFTSLFDRLYQATISFLQNSQNMVQGVVLPTYAEEKTQISETPAHQDDTAHSCTYQVEDDYSNIMNSLLKTSEYKEPKIEILSVGELEYDKLQIPPYQRPYKWNVTDVNLLINDILTFAEKGSKEYRLGTIVLHKDRYNNLNIVDGQQRSITLILLLNELKREEEYSKIIGDIQIDSFLSKRQFHESISKAHLKENINAIRLRLPEFTEEHVRFLLNGCKVVNVTLYDISEAFQFFDSQNARGKDLEPHDLLKAYHLREIPQMTETDRKNIQDWESLDPDRLSNLFLLLFRIKRWINGYEGKEFTSKRVHVFKGPKNSKHILPYQRIYAMAECYAELYNNDISRRIDRQHMEFPHQIDQVTINGTLFFDMIRYYSNLEKEAKQLLKNDFKEISEAIYQYNRTGDRYTRTLFIAAIVFYYDKFADDGFKTAVPKILAWAYSKRLTYTMIQLSTVDNQARDTNSFFKMLHRATSPSEVKNWFVPPLKKSSIIQQKMDGLVDILTKYKYIEQ